MLISPMDCSTLRYKARGLVLVLVHSELNGCDGCNPLYEPLAKTG